jgi:radical SAM protein with 4Fe4S-binding SPASM domain
MTYRGIRRIRYALKQVKFVKSYQDAKILFLDKLPYLVPRLKGDYLKDDTAPPSLQLEPTNYCNIRCISCPRDRMEREKGYMDFNLFQKIIDDAAKTGVKRVHLYLHGEPMLHPDIVRMIAYIKSKNIGISMATNGMLLDREKSISILKSGVNSADYITFSILGCSPETHEEIMKGVKHEKVVQNITDFLALRKEYRINGPIIQTIFYQMPENVNETDSYMAKWENIVDHALCSPFSNSFAKYKKGSNCLIQQRRKTCRSIWERLTIYWNGAATICCEDVDGDYVLGDLGKQSIKQVWNCDRLSSIRKLHREKKFDEIPLCQRCDL